MCSFSLFIIFEMSSSFDVVEIPHELRIRLLYTNPVCLLTSSDPATGARNVMTISWLTPLSNRATFLASMNVTRHSAGIVGKSQRFVLSVPTAADEAMVLAIGKCTGSKIPDKIAHLGVPMCPFNRYSA